MSSVLAPVLFTLVFWWVGTAVILVLDRLPRPTYRWSFGAASVMLVAALGALAATRNDTSELGAYWGFSLAMGVWAWQEMAFLMGFITGPRREACPAGARGWRRVRYAFEVILHHEFALLLLGIAIVGLTWRGANHVGAWTFGVLWLMRLSAKLNVFLGVRNLGESFLPEHLRYLHSYFRKRSMNPLFPVSIIGSVWLGLWVWGGGLDAGGGAFEQAASALIGMLIVLAVLEHALMVLPLEPETLWRFVQRERPEAPAALEKG